jgi:Flp pilus assembly protein TadD
MRRWVARGWRDLGTAIGLGALVLIAYAPALGNGFVNYDDPLYVTHNPVTQQGLSWATVHWAFTTGFAANWHPLTWLSIMLDVELFGLDARGHHATSLLLHALNTVLVFVWMRRLGLRPGASAFAAGLFGLHPLHVESVAWVAERKDVLSMAFGLLALIAYVRYTEAPAPRRMAAVASLLALGLMAKPMLVTLPFALLLLDWWPLRRMTSPAWLALPPAEVAGLVRPVAAARAGLGALLREKIPLFALVALSCVITYAAQKATGSVAIQLPLAYRLLNAVHSYVAYLEKTVLPIHLAALYPLPTQIALDRVAVQLLALAVCTWACWRVRTTRPYLLLGWLWYLGTLVPMIGIVQVGNQAYADRYMYFPSLGLGLAATLLLGDAVARARLPRPLALGAAAALLGVLGLATWKQTRVWSDTVTLFQHAVDVTGRNPLARISLASELIADGRLEDGEAMLKQALAEGAPPEAIHLDLGSIAHRQNRLDEALREFDTVLQIKPDEPKALVNRGIILTEMGRYGEAIATLERVIAARAGNDSTLLIVAHRTLATALQRSGRPEEAMAHLRAADEVGAPPH